MERLARLTICLANKNELCFRNERRMTMNRTIASLIAIGAGVAAYQLAQRNGGMNMRNVRKVGKKMLRPFM